MYVLGILFIVTTKQNFSFLVCTRKNPVMTSCRVLFHLYLYKSIKGYKLLEGIQISILKCKTFHIFKWIYIFFSILNFAIIKEIPTAIQFATYKQVFSKIPYNRWLGRFSCLSYRDKANHLINVSQSKRKSGKKTSHAAMEEAKAIFQEIINLNAFKIITKQALKNAIHYQVL